MTIESNRTPEGSCTFCLLAFDVRQSPEKKRSEKTANERKKAAKHPIYGNCLKGRPKGHWNHYVAEGGRGKINRRKHEANKKIKAWESRLDLWDRGNTRLITPLL